MTIDLRDVISEARMREQQRRDERMYRERDVKNIMFHYGHALCDTRPDEELRREIDEIFDFDEREKATGKCISLS